MPLVLGRPFLATVGAKINVQAGNILYMWREGGFLFPSPIPTPAPTTLTPPPALVPAVPPYVFTSLEVFNGDGGPDIWQIRYDGLMPIPASLGIPSAHTGKVLDPTASCYTFPSPPPKSPPFTIWR